MSQSNKSVFIQLHDPVTLRREILQTAVKAVETLEKYEYFKEIRLLKKRKLKESRNLMHSLHSDIHNLISTLPETEIKEKEKRIINEARIMHNKKPLHTHHHKEKSHRSRTEIKRLEEELEEIKSRLHSIEI